MFVIPSPPIKMFVMPSLPIKMFEYPVLQVPAKETPGNVLSSTPAKQEHVALRNETRCSLFPKVNRKISKTGLPMEKQLCQSCEIVSPVDCALETLVTSAQHEPSWLLSYNIKSATGLCSQIFDIQSPWKAKYLVANI